MGSVFCVDVCFFTNSIVLSMGRCLLLLNRWLNLYLRHVKTIISTIKAYDRASRILPLTAVFTVMTWVIGAVILALTPQTMAITDALLRLTFIGLAALTVPHMMLVDGLFRPRFLTSSQRSNPSSIDIKRDPS